MKVIKLKRVFVMKGDDKEKINLPDPNPTYTPEEVLDHYSADYPKLQTAVVLPGEESEDGKSITFEIKDNFGSKG
jgi:PRTRC genetic system protein C